MIEYSREVRWQVEIVGSKNALLSITSDQPQSYNAHLHPHAPGVTSRPGPCGWKPGGLVGERGLPAGLLRFVVLRAWVYRALLGAALLTVLLTTTVLASLTAYSGAIGDAALRRSLAGQRTAGEAALVVKADVPAGERKAADDAVRVGARGIFDGLPVRVRTLLRSGPYALPLALRPAAERGGNPDLTHFAALDRTQVRTVAGRLPREAVTAGIHRGRTAAERRPAARGGTRRPADRDRPVARTGGARADHRRVPAGGCPGALLAVGRRWAAVVCRRRVSRRTGPCSPPRVCRRRGG